MEIFSWKRLSVLSCPRRAKILVCRDHTFPYHSAIAPLVDKMSIISLILLLCVFPVEKVNLGIYIQRQFGDVNP